MSKKVKFNQNAMGTYEHSDGNVYGFNTTFKKLTVYNAPVWKKSKAGNWIATDFNRVVTVGVNDEKDFDFEALLGMAVNPPKSEIAVA